MSESSKKIAEKFNWMREIHILATAFLGWSAGMSTNGAIHYPEKMWPQAVFSNVVLVGAVIFYIRQRPKWQKEFEDAP